VLPVSIGLGISVAQKLASERRLKCYNFKYTGIIYFLVAQKLASERRLKY